MVRAPMPTCQKCGVALEAHELHQLDGRPLCDDCYLALVHRPTLKVEYAGGDTNFMLRLKDAYTLKKQLFD